MPCFQQTLRRVCKWLVAMGAAVAVLGPGAVAQEWPTKPVRIVVGGPAGGTADSLARIVAEGLGQALVKPVIVNTSSANRLESQATKTSRAPLITNEIKPKVSR